ncbi:MAG: hypothetical protein P9L94_13260 [Candidatus Hinthialibacter antarcticus]|nr:hypothetical protein [Candidatus Hinthialibacter antarcticus]
MNANDYFQLALGVGLFGFGWMLFRFGVNAVGFVMGFLFGYSLYNLLQSLLPIFDMDPNQYMPDNPWIIILFSIVFAVVGIILAKRMYVALVFVGVLAGLLYVLYTDQTQMGYLRGFFAEVGVLQHLDRVLGNLWPAVLSFIIAILVIYMEKQVIILVTACVGSYLIASSVAPILFLPLCFIGYLLQHKQRPLKKQPES